MLYINNYDEDLIDTTLQQEEAIAMVYLLFCFSRMKETDFRSACMSPHFLSSRKLHFASQVFVFTVAVCVCCSCVYLLWLSVFAVAVCVFAVAVCVCCSCVYLLWLSVFAVAVCVFAVAVCACCSCVCLL